jgi:hypothetical protein
MSLTVRGRVALVALVVLVISPWLGPLATPLAAVVLAVVAGLTVVDSPRPPTRVLVLAWSLPSVVTVVAVGTVGYLLAVDADLLATYLVALGLGLLAVLVWTGFGVAALVGVLRRRFGGPATPVEQ